MNLATSADIASVEAQPFRAETYRLREARRCEEMERSQGATY
ncbi:hypothetical protein TTX_0554 [Thermoproteus tenax Kra 1]|uniref:Uncharacterized protein n=1 Tax=Thermoproteus tenax (strain ATCC 35583 / DSM 2078 / JCM 9277 / NBRC 100435 / Kra 1) TaxID=768679 RepID=G4RNS5_THETK|nr:hypothetical protein TTX_0554 [Thermoproteus tenax Kra 1]